MASSFCFSLMKIERNRAPRYRFFAPVEAADIDLNKQLMVRTTNLNAFGCFIATDAPFPCGTKIRLKVNHRGATFIALGQVAYCRSNGMGVRFIKMESAHQEILESWLAELRTRE